MTSCIVQYNRCLELVMSRGWEPIPELFDDEGQRGENPDRPALMRLVERIEEGAVDRAVV